MRYLNSRTNHNRGNPLKIVIPLPIIFSEEQELKSKLEKKGWQILERLTYGQSSPIEKLLTKISAYDTLEIADKDIKDVARILKNSALPHVPLYIKKLRYLPCSELDVDRYYSLFSGYLDYSAITIRGNINELPKNIEDSSLVYSINETYKKYAMEYTKVNEVSDAVSIIETPFSKCVYIKNISHPELGFEFSISFNRSEFGYYNTAFNTSCRKIVKSEIYENSNLNNILMEISVTPKRFSLFEN